MSKLAVDVVLLPDDAMSEKAIAISGRLQKKESGPFRLGREDYLPHITLMIGVIDAADLEKIKNILAAIAEENKNISLYSTGIEVWPNPVGGFVSGIGVEKSALIENIHGLLQKELVPLLSFDATADMYVEPSTIHQSSIDYISGKAKKFAFDYKEYHPHITLGRGVTKETLEPGEFTAKALALYQVGQYTTCRKVLASFPLKA